MGIMKICWLKFRDFPECVNYMVHVRNHPERYPNKLQYYECMILDGFLSVSLCMETLTFTISEEDYMFFKLRFG